MLLWASLIEFVLCVYTWAVLGKLLRGPASEVLQAYGDPFLTSFLPTSEYLTAIAFLILLMFMIPSAISFVWVSMARKIRRDPIFPMSNFYIGIFMIFTVIKMIGLSIACFFAILNLINISDAMQRQAFTPEFLKIVDIQKVWDIIMFYIALDAIWIVYLLCTLFGAVYFLGYVHATKK